MISTRRMYVCMYVSCFVYTAGGMTELQADVNFQNRRTIQVRTTRRTEAGPLCVLLRALLHY